ncbi:hypothetical protein ACVINW_001327 [Bradyrhizobium sp. USDA 4461]
MLNLATILQHTPTWVYALFAVLLILGALSLRPRTVEVWRLLIVPVVFIAWGMYGLLLRLDASTSLPFYWGTSALVAALLAWFGTNLGSMQPDPARGRVYLEGSVVPLARNMILFFAKYSIGIALAYGLYDRQVLYPLDAVISGISAGYFVGWLLRFTQRYRQAAGDARLMSASS